MGRKILQVLRDLVLLVARLVLAAVLALHGWRRWGGGPGIDEQVAYLTSQGVPEPTILAWGAALMELAGAVFLAVGALTPLVGLAVVVEQVLIIVFVAWRNGPFLHAGGYEDNAVLAALALVFVVFGAGRIAVDNLLRRPADEPTRLDEADRDLFPSSKY